MRSRNLVQTVGIEAIAAFSLLFARAALATEAAAWGVNFYGQLGNGTTVDSNVPVEAISLMSGVTAVAAGADHSLSVQYGAAYAWGYNAWGQLGDGTTTDSSVPVAVTGLTSDVTAVAGGLYHSLAIKVGGAYAWGMNADGELGVGTIGPPSTIPVAVGGLSSGVTAIAAGDEFSLAVKDGAAYGWGWNGNGQVGDGTTSTDFSPVLITSLSSGVAAVAAGQKHSLAISNGGLYAWGDNTNGQLGDGTTTQRTTPVLITSLSSGVTAIAAGYLDSLAVQDGFVYAWGFNAEGELGDGTTMIHLTPEVIDPADLHGIIAVAAGYQTSYAISSNGTLWAWGSNDFGEFGNGTDSSPRYSPQPILPPAGYVFTSINADEQSSHAVATLTPVPEPATIVLLAASAAGIAGRRWRRNVGADGAEKGAEKGTLLISGDGR